MHGTGVRSRFAVYILSWIVCLLPLASDAQLRSGAAISLTARLEGTVELSAREIKVSARVRNGLQQEAIKVPLRVKWNLDPSLTQSFRVVSSFRNTTAALTSESLQIAAGGIEASIANAEFRHFNTARGELVILNVNTDPAHRRGELEKSIELRLCDETLKLLPDGVYQGWMRFEVQQQH